MHVKALRMMRFEVVTPASLVYLRECVILFSLSLMAPEGFFTGDKVSDLELIN